MNLSLHPALPAHRPHEASRQLKHELERPSRQASPLPPSVNYHLWAPCNMRCRYCFSTFEDGRSNARPGLPRDEARTLTRVLASRFSKVTFVGGEPTLCPWLDELLETAKLAGATTMLVTNGATLTPERLVELRGLLDWLTVSIDSAVPGTLRRLGRTVSGKPLASMHFENLAHTARAMGIRLKVNTVVTSLNANEDLGPMMLRLRPERWKIFQVLEIREQNPGARPLTITPEAFQQFVDRHRRLEAERIHVIAEDNATMTGSYAMVDPRGRFFDNAQGAYRFSPDILSVGLDAAWKSVEFDMNRFISRSGVYNWSSSPAG